MKIRNEIVLWDDNNRIGGNKLCYWVDLIKVIRCSSGRRWLAILSFEGQPESGIVYLNT